MKNAAVTPNLSRQANPGNSDGQNRFVVRDFRPYSKNTLAAFLTLELPSGLIIHNITLHEKGGSRWVSMPAKEYVKDGERSWAPLVEFTSKEDREKFQACALAAIDAYLGETGE